MISELLLGLLSSALFEGGRSGLKRFLGKSPTRKAVSLTADDFPDITGVEDALTTWCRSNEFTTQIEAVWRGGTILTDEQLVDTFVRVSKFYAGINETYVNGRRVLESFTSHLQEELYKSDKAPIIEAHRAERRHREQQEGLDKLGERLDVRAAEVKAVVREGLSNAVRIRDHKAERVNRAARSALKSYERASCEYLKFLDRRELIDSKHYQELSLLKEIRREHLLQGLSPSGEAGDVRLTPASPDILRWEEEQRGERIQYEHVSLNEVLNNFQSVVKDALTQVPRIMVLGPPGSGKTTLGQFLAWQVAGDGRGVARPRLVPARVRLREWERWALASRNFGLADYLSESYRQAGVSPAPTSELWQRWLTRGETLLILDGLDELAKNDETFAAALRSAFDNFKNCPTVVTCRTLSYERHRSLFPDLPVFTLAGFDEPQRESYIRSFTPKHPGYYNPELLIKRLGNIPQLTPLAANPLLLSLICYVSDEHSPGAWQTKSLPETRGQLYEKALNKLLTRTRRQDVTYPNAQSDLPLIRKIRILERAALSLFAGTGQQRRLLFDEGSIVDALTQGARGERLNDPAGVADALLNDLEQNAGILRCGAGRDYFFLHLTFQEFLVASALARLVDEGEDGWQTRIDWLRGKPTVHRLVDMKAWDPRWREVIILLAGKLREPSPLLELLSDEKCDAIFRQRLALAASCLPEIRRKKRDAIAALVDEITTSSLLLWWRHQLANTSPVVTAHAHALSGLAQVNGRVEETPLSNWLCRLLESGNEDELAGLLAAVSEMGDAAASDPLLDRLTELLRDDDWEVRLMAGALLGRMGAAAGTRPDIIKCLAGMLHSLRRDEQAIAVIAASEMSGGGAFAFFDQLLERALEELNDLVAEHPSESPAKNLVVEIAARELVADRVIAAASTPAYGEHMLYALGPLDTKARPLTWRILSELGRASFSSLLKHLSAWLKARGSTGQSEALAAGIGKMGNAATPGPDSVLRADAYQTVLARQNVWHYSRQRGKQPDFFDSLKRMLRHRDWEVRNSALQSVGDAPLPRPVLEQLAHLLQDPHPMLKSDALWSIGRMGGAAAIPPVLDRLAQMLQEPGVSWQIAAAKAVGSIGKAAATEVILERLIELYQNSDHWLVQNAALTALCELGAIAPSKQFLEELAGLLRGTVHTETLATILKIVKAFGKEAATPEILESLALVLQFAREEAIDTRDGQNLRLALEALEKLGDAALEPLFLERLTELVRESSPSMRRVAAEATLGIVKAATSVGLERLFASGLLAQLVDQLQDSNSSARRQAARVLRVITQSGCYIFASSEGLNRHWIAELSCQGLHSG